MVAAAVGRSHDAGLPIGNVAAAAAAGRAGPSPVYTYTTMHSVRPAVTTTSSSFILAFFNIFFALRYRIT